jgi:hypothetical protein
MKTFNEWLQDREIIDFVDLHLESYLNMKLDLEESFYAGATNIKRENYLQAYKDLLQMAIKNELNSEEETMEKVGELLLNIKRLNPSQTRNLKIIMARIKKAMPPEKDFTSILKNYLVTTPTEDKTPIRPKKAGSGGPNNPTTGFGVDDLR